MAGKYGSGGSKKSGNQRKAAEGGGGKAAAGAEERRAVEGGGGKPLAPGAQAKAPEPGAAPEARAAEPKVPKTGAASRRPSRRKGLTGLEAAAQVLTESGKPMRCGELAKAIVEKGLWKTNGKTPAATLNAGILREIRVKGSASRFKKTGSGLFAGTGVAL